MERRSIPEGSKFAQTYQTLKNHKMGSVKLRMNGRLRLILSSSNVEILLSNRDHHRSSSFSLRSFAAFRWRMVGAYVSLTVHMTTKATTARIRTSQLSHRHPRY